MASTNIDANVIDAESTDANNKYLKALWPVIGKLHAQLIHNKIMRANVQCLLSIHFAIAFLPLTSLMM